MAAVEAGILSIAAVAQHVMPMSRMSSWILSRVAGASAKVVAALSDQAFVHAPWEP